MPKVGNRHSPTLKQSPAPSSSNARTSGAKRAFFIEGERLLITATRKNMKRLATPFQIALLNLRMRVEIHFRALKVCYGLVTSLPRSIDGYLTHYLAALAAHLLA